MVVVGVAAAVVWWHMGRCVLRVMCGLLLRLEVSVWVLVWVSRSTIGLLVGRIFVGRIGVDVEVLGEKFCRCLVPI